MRCDYCRQDITSGLGKVAVKKAEELRAMGYFEVEIVEQAETKAA
jgi:hypothetical protein